MSENEFDGLKKAKGLPMTWEQFLEMREEILGKDIQYQDPAQRICRGTIDGFNLTDERWSINLGWVAFLMGGKWNLMNAKSDAVLQSFAKSAKCEGSVCEWIPDELKWNEKGYYTGKPRGGSHTHHIRKWSPRNSPYCR